MSAEGKSGMSSRAERLQQAAERLLELQDADERQPRDSSARNWRQWSADSGNSTAFDDVAETLLAVQACERPRMPSEEECRADGYDGSVSIAEWVTQPREKRVSLRRRRARALAMAASVVAVALAAPILWRAVAPSYRVADKVEQFETQPAQKREIRLDDGSLITLGARTALTTHYSRERRLIVLDRGEALFEVARDASRPFFVLAGSGSIRALGTSFNVLRDAERVVITVSEGVVEVAPGPSSGGTEGTWSPARVKSGEGMTLRANGKAGAVVRVDSARAMAWREGRLQYLNEPLKHVIADVNRYSRRQIVLDREAGELLYTGDVLQYRIAVWVESLPQIFPVQVTAADAEHVLVRADAEDQSASR